MKILGLPGRFITRAEAGLRAPRSFSRNIDTRQGGWVVHYGGPPQRATSTEQAVARWRQWQQYHMGHHKWADIAYNVGISQQGDALAGRGFFVRSAANGTAYANGRFYAVACILGEGETPSEQMVQALAAVIQHGRNTGSAGQLVLPHSHFRPTACPGRLLTRRIDGWSQMIDLIQTPTPGKPKDPEMNTEQDRRLRDVERDLSEVRGMVEQIVRSLGGRYTTGNPSVGADLLRVRTTLRAVASSQGLETEHGVDEGPVGA